MATQRQVKRALDDLLAHPDAWLDVPQPDARGRRRALSTAGVGHLLGLSRREVLRLREATEGPGKHFPAEDGVWARKPYWWPERIRELLDWRTVPSRGMSQRKSATTIDVPLPEGGTRQALNSAGVADILDTDAATVMRMRRSTQAGSPPGGVPFPAEDGILGHSPYWWPEREQEFEQWQAARNRDAAISRGLLEQKLLELKAVPEAWVAVPRKDPKPGDPFFDPALSLRGAAAILGMKPGPLAGLRSASLQGRAPAGTPPFPAEDGRVGNAPYWRPERAHELVEWQAARPGQGAGGGAGKRAEVTGVSSRDIADRIVQRIARDGLKAGDRLPALIDLAAEYQVSVATVREAVRLLRVKGLVTSVQGVGTFIATPS